jgi:hypothetical protein
MSAKFNPATMTDEQKIQKIEGALKRLRFAKTGSLALIVVAVGVAALNVHLFREGKSTLAHALTPPLVLLVIAWATYSICNRIIANVALLRANGGGRR